MSTAGKANEEIVTTAVSQRGSLLYYADPSLQNDKRIAKLAVAHGFALSFCSPEMQADPDVVAVAVERVKLSEDEEGAAGDVEEEQLKMQEPKRKPWRGSQLQFASKELVLDPFLVKASRSTIAVPTSWTNSHHEIISPRPYLC